MRIPIETGRDSPDCLAPRGRLVLGYQGTLAPDPARCAEPAAGGEEAPLIPEIPLEPWIRDAQRDLQQRLSAGVPECRGGCIDPGALVETLRERLTGILTEALAFDPDANEESLTRRYPALPALLQGAAAEWVDAIAVFHERFHRDASRLAHWLDDAQLPELRSLTPARSDPHAGGHSVLQLLFRDGRCIYYKPRPISGEWLWDRLVHAVNGHSSLQLNSAGALAGITGRYGWVASLTPHAGLHEWDQSSLQASAYWHAAGATLCLAAHVRMTDLHLANVLATSSGPAPVDAESFGSPPTAADSGARHAFAAIVDTLLDTGLLPSDHAGELPDVSGLFGRAAAAPGILVPEWSDGPAGTRRLRMVPSALVDQGNAPPGASPLQVLPQLVSGYREAADALMRCRESLVSPESPWRRTLEQIHAPRIILRDTLTYGLLLSESLHPDQLPSVHRRRSVLRNALRGRSRGALPEAVLRAELRDLLGLHIPRFTGLPGSRTLATSSGRRLAQRFLACSPAEAVLHGMDQLSTQRLNELHVPALLLAILGQQGSS